MKTIKQFLHRVTWFFVGTNTRTANTVCVTLIASIALASCASETIVTTKRPDGKETITVTKKQPPSDGIVTTITNALLGGFLNVFQTK